jgi:Patatin-like phospholipase
MTDELPEYNDHEPVRPGSFQDFLELPAYNGPDQAALPPYADPVEGPQEAKRVLTLDGGGGVRVLSQLYMLKRLLKKKRPCEVFDLIAGTGTGGIIAIMLGRMMMVLRFAKFVLIGCRAWMNVSRNSRNWRYMRSTWREREIVRMEMYLILGHWKGI